MVTYSKRGSLVDLEAFLMKSENSVAVDHSDTNLVVWLQDTIATRTEAELRDWYGKANDEVRRRFWFVAMAVLDYRSFQRLFASLYVSQALAEDYRKVSGLADAVTERELALAASKKTYWRRIADLKEELALANAKLESARVSRDSWKALAEERKRRMEAMKYDILSAVAVEGR